MRRFAVMMLALLGLAALVGEAEARCRGGRVRGRLLSRTHVGHAHGGAGAACAGGVCR